MSCTGYCCAGKSLVQPCTDEWNNFERNGSCDYHSLFHTDWISSMKCICYESLNPDCPSCGELDPVTYNSRLLLREKLLNNAGDKNFYGDILATEDAVLESLEPVRPRGR